MGGLRSPSGLAPGVQCNLAAEAAFGREDFHARRANMMALSQKYYDLLWAVFHFGGYCNSYLATLATGTSRQNTLARLKTWFTEIISERF